MITITSLRVLNALLLGYLLLLSLRIILSWFRASLYGRPWELLEKVTEPYLRVFRRIGFLHKGMLDFSPIAAILVLVVALDLVNGLLFYGRISLGFILASLLNAVWSGASFLLLLLCIIGIVRLVGLLMGPGGSQAFWQVIDGIIRPVVLWISRILPAGRSLGYLHWLGITVALLFTAWFLGGMGTRVLARVLRALPV